MCNGEVSLTCATLRGHLSNSWALILHKLNLAYWAFVKSLQYIVHLM